MAVLTSDATEFLYPLIQAWPTRSPTAETVLVRGEGDEVVFLNDLRHRTHTALSLRLPRSRADIPAVQAVLGKLGSGSGTDYRGAKVMAEVRAVPGTDWRLIAKVDAAEILAEARYRAIVVLLGTGFLILLTGGGTAYGYSRQRAGARRRADEEIRKLSQAVEQSPVSVVVTDAAGTIEYVNRAFTGITGYPAEEVRGANPRLLKSGAQDPDFYRRMWDTLLSGAVWRGEVVNRRKDGAPYTQELVIAPVRDAEGRLVRFVGIGHDVTEAKRLHQSLEQAAAIIEATTDFVGIGHADGRVSYCNRAGRRLLGLAEDADLSTLRIPDTHPEWAARRVMEEGIPAAIRDGTWSGETAFRDSHGGEIPILQTIIAHKAPNGTVEYLSTIARDISERKRAERDLQDALARYRTLVEESLQGICIHRDFVIQFAKSAVARMFDYDSAESLVGRDYRTLFAAGERARLDEYYAARLRQGAAPSQYDIEGVRKDGTSVWVELLVSLVQWEGVLAVQVAAVDVTERKRAEAVLRQSEKLSAMGILLAGVAHELNNPLSVILGHASRREPGDERALCPAGNFAASPALRHDQHRRWPIERVPRGG